MRAAAVVLVALVLSPLAIAQDGQDGLPPGEARTRATRTVDCLERVERELTTTMRLLRDAARQTESGDAAVARDAATTVVSLEQRVADLSRALKACVPEAAQLRPQTVVQEPTGVEAAVGEANDIPAVERDTELSRNVHVIIGHRVDGTGTVPHANIKRGVRGISSRLERCYAQMVDRGALTSGQLDLTFSVTTDGRVRDALVERSTIDDGRFQNCVRYAGRRIRPGTISRGGDARYTYTLRFGRQAD